MRREKINGYVLHSPLWDKVAWVRMNQSANPRAAQSARGYTVVEVVIALAAVILLAATLSPLAIKYVRDARIARAQTDIRVIGGAIKKFEQDLARFPMFTSGAGILSDNTANIGRLQGPGALPSEVTVSAWTAASPADADCSQSCVADSLVNQLIANGSAYPTSTSSATPFVWKGPYLERVETDPWGNAYLVNIIHAKSTSTDALFVLSAGPNGTVETAFDVPTTTLLTPGGDDIVFRIK